MKYLSFTLLALLALVAFWGIRDSSAQNATGVPANADIGAGRVVAEQRCGACHGLDGKGIAPGIPNLAGQGYRYLVAALKEYKDGKRIHAALRVMAENLNEAGERNVVAYYASLRPPVPAKQTEIFSPYDHGKGLAPACTSCHGANGNSTTPGMPSLSGQQPDYFIAAVQEYLTGARVNPPMLSLLRNLKSTDLESLALYFASQSPAQRHAPLRGDPAAGESLTVVCAGCHSSKGVSTDSATPNLAGQDPQYLIDALKAYRAGREHPIMQRAISGLVKSDTDAENIAAFYAVQRGAPSEHGQTLVQDIANKCNRCHTNTVNNPSLAIPNINGQDRDYLVMALRSYREGRRESSAMHGMTLRYRDSVIEGIASYFTNQPPR